MMMKSVSDESDEHDVAESHLLQKSTRGQCDKYVVNY